MEENQKNEAENTHLIEKDFGKVIEESEQDGSLETNLGQEVLENLDSIATTAQTLESSVAYIEKKQDKAAPFIEQHKNKLFALAEKVKKYLKIAAVVATMFVANDTFASTESVAGDTTNKNKSEQKAPEKKKTGKEKVDGILDSIDKGVGIAGRVIVIISQGKLPGGQNGNPPNNGGWTPNP